MSDMALVRVKQQEVKGYMPPRPKGALHSAAMGWWSQRHTESLRAYLELLKCAASLALNLYQDGTGMKDTEL